MANYRAAIFERVGPTVYCGDALYYGGQGWLGGKRQRVWVTASIQVRETASGPGPFSQPPRFFGTPHAALETGITGEFLQYIWALDALVLSEVCMAFCYTLTAARRAFITLRWEQSLAKIVRDIEDQESFTEEECASSISSWPSPDDYPRAYHYGPREERDHRRRQQPSNSSSDNH